MPNGLTKRAIALYLLMLWPLVLLSACTPESGKNEEIDLSPQTDEMELQADYFHIWWDDSFGAPYETLMKPHLANAFGETRFDAFGFMRPFYNPSTKTRDLFQELLRKPSPDLIVFDSMYLSFFIESNYLAPVDHLEPYLAVEDAALEEVRTVAPDFSLYAIPYGESVYGLFYNKTLFDLMDVPYPRDGMTWDETFQLASQVKKPMSWVALDVDNFSLVASQIPLRLADFDEESWLKWDQFVAQFLRQREGEAWSNGIWYFYEGKVAMVAASLMDYTHSYLNNVSGDLRLSKVDWDVVSFPVFSAEQPVAPARRMLLLGVPRMAENKEDAFKIIRRLLTEPVQRENMRLGLLSVRDDADAWAEEFGAAYWSDKSTSFLSRSIPTGKYDYGLDKQSIHQLATEISFNVDDRWDWTLRWDQDSVRRKVMEYRGKRADVIGQLREKVAEYERYRGG